MKTFDLKILSAFCDGVNNVSCESIQFTTSDTQNKNSLVICQWRKFVGYALCHCAIFFKPIMCEKAPISEFNSRNSTVC